MDSVIVQCYIRRRNAPARTKTNRPSLLLVTKILLFEKWRTLENFALYIAAVHLIEWTNPHVCPAVRQPNRPPTPYYTVRAEDRAAPRKKRRLEKDQSEGDAPSARRRVVSTMEVGGEDSLRELQRLTAAIGSLLDERRTILHRRIYEVLQGALEEAEEESPVSSDDENDKDEDEDIEDEDGEDVVILVDSGSDTEPLDTKGKPVKKEGQEENDDWGC